MLAKFIIPFQDAFAKTILIWVHLMGIYNIELTQMMLNQLYKNYEEHFYASEGKKKKF